jgi:hypothetical protein
MRTINNITYPAFVLFSLACFGFWPQAQGQLSPPTDGCYPNYTTAEGCNALAGLGTGAGNTGIGWYALVSDTTGSYNTGVGAGALTLNNADSNTAVGAAALLLNTSGTGNVAVGTDALVDNDTGLSNNALGAGSLFSNLDGSYNNAFGQGALGSNIHGASNTAMGDEALIFNDGNYNTALGASALYSNGDGEANTAVGFGALESNDAGSGNVALGAGALLGSTSGIGNTAVGAYAGDYVSTASNVICLGWNVHGADVSNTTWIGNVYGAATQSGATAPVVVSDGGQLGTVVSSERFKKDIASMDKTSEAILALKPVTFHYKSDPKDIPQFGLIAEEVAKVNPALVLPDKEGKPYTVRYDAVNAMLLNEFLKEHSKVAEQETTITQLKTEFQATTTRQQKQIEALAAGLQKVSAQLQLSKSAPQTVLNNQ